MGRAGLREGTTHQLGVALHLQTNARQQESVVGRNVLKAMPMTKDIRMTSAGHTRVGIKPQVIKREFVLDARDA